MEQRWNNNAYLELNDVLRLLKLSEESLAQQSCLKCLK